MESMRLKVLQEYLDAERNLKELQTGYKQSRSEWEKAINTARKRCARLLNDLYTGQYQQELPFERTEEEEGNE